MEFPTYEQFKAWLESKSPEEFVGRAGLTAECPGANCAGHYGATDPRVSTRKWSDGADIHKLPTYAQQFICDIDLAFGFLNPVSAEQALILLEGIAP